jgi:hypothetical protein
VAEGFAAVLRPRPVTAGAAGRGEPGGRDQSWGGGIAAADYDAPAQRAAPWQIEEELRQRTAAGRAGAEEADYYLRVGRARAAPWAAAAVLGRSSPPPSEKAAELAQNFSLLSLCSHWNAWANFHLLGQPNTFPTPATVGTVERWAGAEMVRGARGGDPRLRASSQLFRHRGRPVLLSGGGFEWASASSEWAGSEDGHASAPQLGRGAERLDAKEQRVRQRVESLQRLERPMTRHVPG